MAISWQLFSRAAAIALACACLPTPARAQPADRIILVDAALLQQIVDGRAYVQRMAALQDGVVKRLREAQAGKTTDDLRQVNAAAASLGQVKRTADASLALLLDRAAVQDRDGAQRWLDALQAEGTEAMRLAADADRALVETLEVRRLAAETLEIAEAELDAAPLWFEDMPAVASGQWPTFLGGGTETLSSLSVWTVFQSPPASSRFVD